MVRNGKFLLSAKNVEAAARVLKETLSLKADNLGDALRELKWKIVSMRNGDILGIQPMKDAILNRDAEWMAVIAPFVEPGSLVQFTDDHHEWQWTFKDDGVDMHQVAALRNGGLRCGWFIPIKSLSPHCYLEEEEE